MAPIVKADFVFKGSYYGSAKLHEWRRFGITFYRIDRAVTVAEFLPSGAMTKSAALDTKILAINKTRARRDRPGHRMAPTNRVYAGILAASLLILAFSVGAQLPQPEVLDLFHVGPDNPNGDLVQDSAGNFYGTAGGGDNGRGLIFEITTNGSWFTLATFGGTNGQNPLAGLTLGEDGNLYGTTYAGGDSGSGTVFRVTPSGIVTALASFNFANGAYPQTALTLGRDGKLYGTTSDDGPYGNGTIFSVTTNGVLTTLVSFNWTNGAYPVSRLTLAGDGNFYGTTQFGASAWDNGIVFRMAPDGTFTELFSFGGTNGVGPCPGLTLGPDGDLYGISFDGPFFRLTTNGTVTTIAAVSVPSVPLTLGRDGCFYGAAGNPGSVFRITTNGDVTVLYSFEGGDGRGPKTLALGRDGCLYGTTATGGASNGPISMADGGTGTAFRISTNGLLTTLAYFAIDGANPYFGLTLGNDGNFYGTMSGGGAGGVGTIFRVAPDGAFTTLLAFMDTNGASPGSGLTLGPGGCFYGATSYGGDGGRGTLFRFAPDGALTSLVSFMGPNGALPQANPTWGADDCLYGTTSRGGDNGAGVVFKATTNGQLTVVVSFDGANGEDPSGPLTLAGDGNLYGVTSTGGISNCGTLFRITKAGQFKTLVSFVSTNGSSPSGGLTVGVDGNLYGMTLGTLFKVTTNGMLTTLTKFTNANPPLLTVPMIIGSDGNFYGTSWTGGLDGNDGQGLVFQATTNGNFSVLTTFSVTNGAEPKGGLALGTDGNFYGTAWSSADSLGAIYRLRRGAYMQTFGLATNGFRLNALNVGGSGMVLLEASADLITWAPILTNGTAAAQQFLDSTAPRQPQRFYRVVQQ